MSDGYELLYSVSNGFFLLLRLSIGVGFAVVSASLWRRTRVPGSLAMTIGFSAALAFSLASASSMFLTNVVVSDGTVPTWYWAFLWANSVFGLSAQAIALVGVSQLVRFLVTSSKPAPLAG